jgi:hypothetical protein
VAGLPRLLRLSLSGFETPRGGGLRTLMEAVLEACSDLLEGTFELPCINDLLCMCTVSLSCVHVNTSYMYTYMHVCVCVYVFVCVCS